MSYSEIPKSCNPCGKDLLHHDAYHLVYHHNCKFCRFNKFKYRAESEKELHKIIKEEEKYYATVCPYCDNNFSEKPFRNKHIQYAHEKILFKCNDCDKTFTSNNAKVYLENVIHVDNVRQYDNCEETLSAAESLQKHLKYADSEIR